MSKLLEKLLSGRLILTTIAGLVFAYCSMKKILNAECISAICSMVFISYFQRNDRMPEGKNGNNQ